ncbi:MAG: YjfB family protein [Phycisphaeraceae bacterium]|nr:YjfB family protein [Phycisphaeraceae bacterium]
MAPTSIPPAATRVDLKSQISVAVARKGLDAQKQAGAAAIELLQAAVATASANPLPGGTIDVRA